MKWLAAALCACLLAGCFDPRIVPVTGSMTVDTLTIDGYTEIFCTREGFYDRWPGYRTTDAIMFPCEHDGEIWMSHKITNGCYDATSNTLWVVCADPRHPDLDGDEGWCLKHERAHRTEALFGWDAAEPLWREIAIKSPKHMTHPEIKARLGL